MGSAQSKQPEETGARKFQGNNLLGSGGAQVEVREEESDEPDEWDKRINSTGCSADKNGCYLDENTRMNDCVFEKKDWRGCQKELEELKRCWKRYGNDKRTSSRDAK